MHTEPIDGAGRGDERLLNELLTLRQFPGLPAEFWPRFLSSAGRLAAADITVLLLRQPGEPRKWVKLGEWSAAAKATRFRAQFSSQLEPIGERALAESAFCQPGDAASGSFSLAVRLNSANPADEIVLAAQVLDFTDASARESLLRLQLVADTPRLYQLNLSAVQAARDVEKFAGVLDLLVPVNEADEFISACLAFRNGIATRFACDRASLGWVEGGYIRLRAMSRTEQFDRRMGAAQALEIAMEECLDQDEEIIFPLETSQAQPQEAAASGEKSSRRQHLAAPVSVNHEKFSAEQKVSNLCSVPIRLEGEPVAVLTCERNAAPFTETDLRQLRLCCDQAARRLGDLKSRDGWFGARWAADARKRLASLFGPEHTWSKIAALGTVLLLIALFIIHVNYRVEGNFMLRSDEASYLTAPFDGYIESVFVRPGDAVDKGGKLLALNRSEFLLEESAAAAELARYQREAQKAEADHKLAEKRIADAMARQAQARLDLARYHLDNAVIKSPFKGVVVEGDLRERIAAPLKQGDALFKVARLDTLYAEGEIKERDVKEILGRSKGQIAFVSQPKLKFPVSVVSIEPAAMTRKEGNVFIVRLKIDGSAQPWWRPGMTGLCKINAEKRSLFWILTHRTVDFLRMKLWF
ncbi:MAG TPA: efflux RND transporter periplasmic adaptor subunit [Verrucomicrobiae bacterium]|nr:efflux RND transporter periplasmic adaptor subunit [Verrucomicrobiae bacterium]